MDICPAIRWIKFQQKPHLREPRRTLWILIAIGEDICRGNLSALSEPDAPSYPAGPHWKEISPWGRYEMNTNNYPILLNKLYTSLFPAEWYTNIQRVNCWLQLLDPNQQATCSVNTRENPSLSHQLWEWWYVTFYYLSQKLHIRISLNNTFQLLVFFCYLHDILKILWTLFFW